MGDCVYDQPSVGELRSRLGLPPPASTPNLTAAQDCTRHAWMLYEYVVAHLVYAARGANGEALAPFIVQEWLHEWAEAPHEFNRLADELVAEAAAWPQADWPRYSDG